MMSTRVPWPGGSGALGAWLLSFCDAELLASVSSWAWLALTLVSSTLASTGGFAGGGGGGGGADAVTLETLIVNILFLEFLRHPAPAFATSGEFDPAHLNERAASRPMLNRPRTAWLKTAEDFTQMRANHVRWRACAIRCITIVKPSCPRVSRAPTPWQRREVNDVDGRDKPGKPC
jgi:hypothetical protein